LERVILRNILGRLPGRDSGSVRKYLSKEEPMFIETGPDLAKVVEDPTFFKGVFQAIIAGIVYVGRSCF
jgi:hypothetical protein